MQLNSIDDQCRLQRHQILWTTSNNMIPCDSIYGEEDEGIEANIPLPDTPELNETEYRQFRKMQPEQPCSASSSTSCLLTSHKSEFISSLSKQFRSPGEDAIKYLPIKKRRVKESKGALRGWIADDTAADSKPAIAITPTAQKPQTSQSTAMFSMYTDNSRAWWVHANQSWNKNASRSSQSASATSKKNSKDVKPKPQGQEQSKKESRLSNIQLLQRHNLDKDDPRSAEYQLWFDSYYPTNSLPSNKLLEQLKLVNPEAVGNRYPPWVTYEELDKWDIKNINSRVLRNPIPPVAVDIISANLAKDSSMQTRGHFRHGIVVEPSQIDRGLDI